MVSLPIFVICFLLLQIGFDVIWRYMAWANQTLAMVVLWAITFYLYSEKKMIIITFIPAVFMTFVCTTYIMIAPEGFHLSNSIAYIISILLSIIIVGLALLGLRKMKKNID